MLRRASTLFAVTLALAACSSSSSSGPSAAVPGPAFAKYCTATLKTEKDLMKPAITGGWFGDGSLNAGPGTTFLLGIDERHWTGYVLEGDGTPTEIAGDFQTGLVKDTDFTSDCADDAKLQTDGSLVLLEPIAFYSNADLSGAACTLAIGTELTQYVLSSISQSSTEISANEIKATCGLDKAYAKSLIYGSLVAR